MATIWESMNLVQNSPHTGKNHPVDLRNHTPRAKGRRRYHLIVIQNAARKVSVDYAASPRASPSVVKLPFSSMSSNRTVIRFDTPDCSIVTP
jgi:hypothetical protein